MDNWIELISFIYPHEASLPKIKLESEGVQVWIKDELTAQVNNYLSNAIGGVKLFVKEEDYNNARQILIESGYIKEEILKQNKFITSFDAFTSKIPIFGKFRFELRLLISIAFILTLIITPIYISTLPSTEELLVMRSWQVDKMYYKGKEIKENLNDLYLTDASGNLTSNIMFYGNGTAFFPQVDTVPQNLKWRYTNHKLIIYSDTITVSDIPNFDNSNDTVIENKIFNSVFNGEYQVRIRGGKLELKSDKMVILCRISH